MGLAELLGLGNLTSYGRAGGGCINEGSGYVTPEGLKIFVKKNTRSEVSLFKAVRLTTSY